MSSFVNAVVAKLLELDKNKLAKLKQIVLEEYDEILLFGNGGSNAISSHMAEDYTKALKKKSQAFTDGARLTCYANDYGYDNCFLQFLKEFSTPKSLIVLISSSGNSKNIINCAEYCKTNGLSYLLFTGFEEFNMLRKNYSDKCLLDFWIDSTDYGVVECMHEIILHSVIE